MARRRFKTTRSAPKAPFADADDNINLLERVVCYRTVTPRFDPRDLIDFLWPMHIVEHLTAAFPYIKTGDRTSTSDELFLPGLPRINFYFNLPTLGMCAPAAGQVQLQPSPKQHEIMTYFREVNAVHQEHNIVRACVNWCNTHATPGAARYYFPTLGALLPPNHVFHQVQGDNFREPASMASIAPLMRRAASVISTGLLLNPHSVTVPVLSTFHLTIYDETDPNSEAKKSQVFHVPFDE